MTGSERIRSQILRDNPHVRITQGRRHFKVFAGGRLAGIIPFTLARDGLDANLRRQLSRAGISLSNVRG